VEKLTTEFTSIATKIEAASIGDAVEEKRTLQDEIQDLLQPVITEMKDATLAPRHMEALRRSIEELEERRTLVVKVVTKLEERLTKNPPAVVQNRVNLLLGEWRPQLDELAAEIDVKRFRLSELEADDESVIDKTSKGAQKFFRTRGKHLALSILGFIVTFFLVRQLYALFRRLNPIHRKKGKTLYARALDLAAIIVGFLLAILVFVLVLYLANDWVLLVVALLFLGSLAWAGKQALPQFFEQGKLMLNFGTVREGERLVYDGVPWKVGRIKPYTNLTNPLLKGGLIRLPIRQLMEMHSRPHEDEIWFPTRQDDWVKLSDGTLGKIVSQTPEHVEVLRLGGSRIIIPTVSFLDLNPENLSGGFRISSVFGIDYSHQSISTTEVPAIFEEAITAGLKEVIDPELIRNISVQFASANASSLDYQVQADFAGGASQRYRFLERSIQRICVEVCNEQDWGIPFSQLTIHQA